MKFSIKSAVALLAVTAFPLLAVAPASAVAFDRLNFTIDCGPEETGEDNHVITADETLVITLANCAGLYIRDFDNTGNVTMTSEGVLTDTLVEIPTGVVTLTITGDINVDLDYSLLEETGPDFFDVDIDVLLASEATDPDSTLLETETVTLELGAPETMIREDMIGDPVGDNGSGAIYMGNNENCQVNPGLHVYTTLDLTVNTAGTYDFRAVSVSPIDDDLNWGVASYPSSDPFVALYRNFNPADPESGIVGCNDDGDDSGFPEIDDQWYWLAEDESYEGLVTESGSILQNQWPWFRSDLTPGEYTLVYMPYSAMGTTDFGLGQYDASENTPDGWEPVAQSVTYEMWGPEGGLTLGGLANTGVEPMFALWTGLALAGTGVAITVARRRAVRA